MSTKTPRVRKNAGEEPAPPRLVPVIVPTAIFTLATAGDLLDLAPNCLPREIRLGRLKAAKRAGRYMILGAWLLDWIREAGVKRQRKPIAVQQAAAPAA